MLKKNALPEPLAWTLAALLAPALALPWALGENRLTPTDFMDRPALIAGETRLPRPETALWEVEAARSAPTADEAALLRPETALWETLVARQPARRPDPSRYDELIAAAAHRRRVSPLLIKAIISAESNFNPGAVSPNGAMGLMQIMPTTARAFGAGNPHDPAQNIEAGVQYLKTLLNSFGDDEELAVAAYNCGPEAMKRFNNEIPPFPETRNYVERVMKYYNRHLDG